VQQVLSEAILRRGIPKLLYVDYTEKNIMGKKE